MPRFDLIPCYLVVTLSPCNTSRRRCHTAVKLLNMLIPNFENRADTTENLEVFCAPVCVSFVYNVL
jgi:hypothetical protein